MHVNHLICIAASVMLIIPSLAEGQQKRKPGLVFGSEVRVPDEVQPAGATVQLKLELTEPKPISSGTKLMELDPFAFDAVYGISLWSPAGDVFGVARVENGKLTVQSISPLASFGTSSDYPILTVAAHIRSDAIVGQTFPLTLGAGSTFTNVLGQSEPFILSKPGTLTIGGTASIHNVLPGGGTWPAGTVVRIVGSGFDSAARIRTKFMTRSAQVVSPTEIQLVLARTVEMDAQQISVTNPNGDRVEYYSYLRGVAIGASAQPAVAAARAIYPRLKFQRVAMAQQGAGVRGTVLTGLALQNPNAETARIELVAWTPASGVIARAAVTLALGEEITRELGEYFARKLSPGTVVRVTASVPVQVVGFTADSSTGNLQPFISLPF